jgi:hypothetical protein
MDPHKWTPRRPPGRFVVPVRLDPAGRTGPTPGAARGARWKRVGGGYYLPAGTDRTTTEQRIADVWVRLPPGAALTGWSSLRMQGGAFFDGLEPDGRTFLPVRVRVPPGCHPRPRPGVEFVEGTLDPVVSMWGMPCTAVRQAVLDEMRLADDLRESVVAMDMAAAAELTSIRRMTRYLERRTSWRGVPGIPQVRSALALADERSASPQETRLRLVWRLDAGLPTTEVNVPVFDRTGRLLGYPDLLDVAAGFVAEYDGEDHRAARRHSSDVDREDRFRRVRLEVTRVTSLDLPRTGHLVTRLRAARGRASFEPPEQRSWTLEHPPGFTPQPALDTVLDRRGVPR